MKRLLVAGTTMLFGCSGTEAPSAADARAGDAHIPVGDFACVTQEEQNASFPAYPFCEQVRELARPRTVIDLRGTTRARCDNWDYGLEKPNYAHVLPNDPAAYPVVLKVGTGGFAGECSSCNSDSTTKYGVAFRAEIELLSTPGDVNNRTLIVRAPAPWFITAGGTGEADPYPCDGGYQEFATPRACLWSHSIGYGIVTADANAPDADIHVDLVPTSELEGEAGKCCPYACE